MTHRLFTALAVLLVCSSPVLAQPSRSRSGAAIHTHVEPGRTGRQRHGIGRGRASVAPRHRASARPALIQGLIPPSEILPLSQVHSGMDGYGLTVFRGTKVEKFHVHVIDIVRKAYMGRDLILIRMSGGPITSRGANIIAGMSGSPVYLKGRLAGAVSMGNLWPKEPVAMVTPVEYMTEALNPRLPTTPQFSAVPWSRQLLNFANSGFGEGVDSAADRDPWSRLSWAAQSLGYTPEFQPQEAALAPYATGASPGALRPLMTPIYARGLNPNLVARLNRAFSPFGLTVESGMGGGEAPASTSRAPIVPGSMISVSYCTGDIDLTGWGTVTYRKGNRILAFGHPMEQLGPVDFPLSRAYVVDVFSGYPRSEKMCVTGAPVGVLEQDRPWSVMGALAKSAHTVPLTVAVQDEQTGISRTFHMHCVDHPLFTGAIADTAAQQAVSQVRSYPGDSMANVRVEVDAAGMKPIVRSNTYFDYFSPNGMGMPALGDMERILDILQSNPFRVVPVKGIKVSIKIRPGRQVSAIERIAVNRSTVAPGDHLELAVTLHPWKAEPYVVPMDVQIPVDAAGGPATLMVTGGMMSPLPSPPSVGGGITIIIGGGGRSMAEPASSVEEMLERYLKSETNDQLVARVVQSTSPSFNISGSRLYNLPPALAAVLHSPRTTGALPLADEAKTDRKMNCLIVGAQGVAIMIQRRETSTAAAPAPPEAKSSPALAPAQPANKRTAVSAGGRRQFSQDPEPEPEPDSVPAGDVIVPPLAGPAPQRAPESKPGGASVETPGAPGSAASTSDPASDAAGKKLQTWTMHTAADFAGGHGVGVAVSSSGELVIAPRFSTLKSLAGDDFIWALRADRDRTVLAATGNHGRVYRAAPDGAVTELLRSSELDMLAIAVAKDGTIYVGSAPHGYVYRIPPQGAGKGPVEPFFRTGKNYVLSLAVDAGGSVYAGTNGGCIYKISPAGVGSVWFHSNETHICSLAMASNGDLIAGTAPSGLVYRIDPQGNSRVLWDCDDTSASAVAVLPDGDILAGTAPKGLVFRISGSGDARLLFKTDTSVHDIGVGGSRVLVAAGQSLYQVTASDDIRKFQNDDDQELLAVAVREDGSGVAGTGTVPALYSLEQKATNNTFRTVVKDAGLAARWGHVRWQGDQPAGSSLRFDTRTGNSALPDNSWSLWSASGVDGEIRSPQGRYLQVRATLSASSSGKSPVVRNLTVSYLPENRPPTLTVSSPSAGAFVHGKTDLNWQAQDPDGDALLYNIQLSPDDGATWRSIQVATKDGKGATAPLTANSYTWDTSAVSDGNYLLRVSASDRRSNPVNACETSVITGPFCVSNAGPKLQLTGDPQIGADQTAVFRGLATGSKTEITSVSFRVDQGPWFSCLPQNGIFDALNAPFSGRSEVLTPGEHQLEVQAMDSAGNRVSSTSKLKVPGVSGAAHPHLEAAAALKAH